MGFPCVSGDQVLSRQDFYRFELQFTRTVLDFFPCEGVRFIIDGLTSPAGEGLSEGWQAGLVLVRQKQGPVVDAEARTIFLPIRSGAELVAVAVLTGCGQDLCGRYSEDWLLERGRLVSREFSLLKRWGRDPVSGVLNATYLRTELALLVALTSPPSPPVAGQLLLIEVAMRDKDADQALHNISRTAAYLDSLVADQAVVYHVGSGIFALIWHGEDLDQAQRLGYTLLRKLKRQGTQRVHIGIAPVTGAGQREGGGAADHILDQAWEALGIARRRGTFALSAASGAAETTPHPLAPPVPEILSQLKRLWKGDNQFSIVFLQKDTTEPKLDSFQPSLKSDSVQSPLPLDGDEGTVQSPLQSDGDGDSVQPSDEGSFQSTPQSAVGFPLRVRALIGEGAELIVVDANRTFIYLAGVDEQVAADWAGALANRVLHLGIGTFSMGVASYPCPGFHKADIPQNAKKALVHTQFFGAGTITSFSGVSLNISGDVYYNEGDLVSAIREYRLGLNLNPDNINLLNSLGVIYAQIDAYAKAIPLFERAITLNPGDFMALFNLGFAHLGEGESDQALRFFEQAEKVDDSYFDLLLQLGQLYCQRRRYKDAVKVLTKAEKSVSAQGESGEGSPWEHCEPWQQGARHELGHGLVYRYLGESYKGIGKNREAMTYLQRAARYNSQDSEALSLLGELYAAEKQGLDIALAFCRQAVAIDSGRAPHWYRLALVLNSRDDWEEAMNAVQRCLSLDPKHIEALMLKAAIHEKLQQTSLARSTYEKVLRLDGTHPRAAKALKKINQIRR